MFCHISYIGDPYLIHQWGPEITDDPAIRDRAHFRPWALGGTDSHGENDHPKYWTLDSLMKHNGMHSDSRGLVSRQNFISVIDHKFIDILKIDTEGAEFDALTSFVNAHARGDLPIGQLQVEIHAVGRRANFEYFLDWWESLEAVGLRAYSLEPNLIHITKPGCKKPEVVEVRLLHRVLEVSRRPEPILQVFAFEHSWKSCARQRFTQVGESVYRNSSITKNHHNLSAFPGCFIDIVIC